MSTAGDQINRALRLLGVLAEGETPGAAVSQDALTALNQMIDSWNTERLSSSHSLPPPPSTPPLPHSQNGEFALGSRLLGK